MSDFQSKYLKRGPYHFVEFSNPNEPYAKHVDDVLYWLEQLIGADNGTKVHEVGCGDGLILNQIDQRLGWQCTGNDSDELAVSMARRLNPSAGIAHSGSAFLLDHKVDVVLFCDCLEHIKAWKEHLEWAKETARWIVIAVPDRHDRHGVQDFDPTSFDKTLSDWAVMHRATRHARHFTVWGQMP